MLVGCSKAVAPASGSTSTSSFSFKRSAETIRGAARVQALENRIEQNCAKRLFGTINEPVGNGWIGDLYGRLSEYAHARPGRTLGDIRQSNGPIYVGLAVQEVHMLFVETFCAVSVLAGIGRSALTLPTNTRAVIDSTEVTQTKVASFALHELFPIAFG